MFCSISNGVLMIVAGDFKSPPNKICFDSTLCPTAPARCNQFCIESLGHPKGGVCLKQGTCCCNLT